MEPSKVPSGLIHVIRRATRENPRDRYQTVGELIDAVKTYQMAREPGRHRAGGDGGHCRVHGAGGGPWGDDPALRDPSRRAGRPAGGRAGAARWRLDPVQA